MRGAERKWRKNTLKNETRLRAAAEENAAIASGALDKIFQRFAVAGANASTLNASLTSAPTLSNEAAELLEELIRYYDELAARDELDGQMSRSAGEAQVRDRDDLSPARSVRTSHQDV